MRPRGGARAPRPPIESSRSVLAVVLTHDAPESLARCLSSIEAQSYPPAAVLVVDNASEPAVALPPSQLDVTLLRSENNGGPAGGHEIGLRTFLESGHDLAWVMDDHCIPAPTCLEELLAATRTRGRGPGFRLVGRRLDRGGPVPADVVRIPDARTVVEELVKSLCTRLSDE